MLGRAPRGERNAESSTARGQKSGGPHTPLSPALAHPTPATATRQTAVGRQQGKGKEKPDLLRCVSHFLLPSLFSHTALDADGSLAQNRLCALDCDSACGAGNRSVCSPPFENMFAGAVMQRAWNSGIAGERGEGRESRGTDDTKTSDKDSTGTLLFLWGKRLPWFTCGARVRDQATDTRE